VGALFVSRRIRFQPLLFGGGQESKRRSGTENVAGIVGLGQAAELAREALAGGLGERLGALRDRFENGIIEKISGVEVNGHPENRLPNTSNLHFAGVDGEGLLILLDEAGVCCSPGSACSTGAVKPSRILQAMGQAPRRARGSVRFSISRFTTEDEIERAISAVAEATGKLRLVLPAGDRRVSFHS
jgi:cysteine desulfurase